MKKHVVGILILIALGSNAWCQEMTMVQLKALDTKLQPYPDLEIAINNGEVSKLNRQGIAFAEIATLELPPKSISVLDKKLEVESWNFSKGILEIIVRVKTYQSVTITVQDQDNQLLEGVTVEFRANESITSVSNDKGIVNLALPLEVNLNKTDQLYVKGYLLIEKRFKANKGLLKVKPIPKATESRKIENNIAIKKPMHEMEEIDQFQHFNFEYLDSIKSLTVFYAVIKNVAVEDFDESMKRQVDAKFYELIRRWEDSLVSVKSENFIGRISDSSLVQHDVAILIDHAIEEGNALTRIRTEFDNNVTALGNKLEGGGVNLTEAESEQILESIALLTKILDENEDKFYENQSQFRKNLSMLTNHLKSIGDLEEQLILSENQRAEQSKDFNQKLMTAIAVSLVLALFGIISFVLYSKFKKQKNQLSKANAEVKRINEHLEELVSKRTDQLQETNKELDTFLYKSSHDLRRPLTTIVGLSNIARLTLSKDALELFNRATNTAKQMDKMLKKLISVNKIHHPSKYCAINFKAQVDETVTYFEDTIKDKKITLKTSVQKGIAFNSYPEVIEIILKNLVENAVWYSSIEEEQAKPMVNIRVAQENGHVLIELKDNGPGVENSIQERIWEMFFVGHEKSIGNGLGLYLVQKAVKELKGSIQVYSINNSPTKFEVKLPVGPN